MYMGTVACTCVCMYMFVGARSSHRVPSLIDFHLIFGERVNLEHTVDCLTSKARKSTFASL